jgi:hypothetical protein
MAQHVGAALVAYAVLGLLFLEKGRRLRLLVGLGVIGAVWLAVLYPLYLPYQMAKENVTLATPSILRGQSLQVVPALLPGRDPMMYQGLARLALTAVGLLVIILQWRRLAALTRRRFILLFLFCAGAFVIALGPSLIWRGRPIAGLPYGWLWDAFPPIRAFRFLNRWMEAASLAMAVFGAIGIMAMARTIRAKGRHAPHLLATALVLLVLLDTWWVEAPLRWRVPRLDQEVLEKLETMPANTVVSDVVEVWRESDTMIRQTQHWKPLIQGYSGYAPPGYYARAGAVQSWPLNRGRQAMIDLNVDAIIVPARRARALERQGNLLEEVLAQGEQFALLRPIPELPEAPSITPAEAPREIPIREFLYGVMEPKPDDWWRTLSFDPGFLFKLEEPVAPQKYGALEIVATLDSPQWEHDFAEVFWSTEPSLNLNHYQSLKVGFQYSSEPQTLLFDFETRVPGWDWERSIRVLRFDPCFSENALIKLHSIRFLPQTDRGYVPPTKQVKASEQ